MTIDDKLHGWLGGHPEAIAFILAVHEAVELWDDLIDKDKDITPMQINRSFLNLFVTIPRNQFYQDHFELLNPIIEASILDWHTANQLECDRKDLETAFGLRCTGQLLTVMCARIIGGFNWAHKVNMEIRTMGETYGEYVSSLGVK